MATLEPVGSPSANSLEKQDQEPRIPPVGGHSSGTAPAQEPLDAASWRAKAKEGELVTLPSGMVVRRKRVHILDLAAQGKIPEGLGAIASELVSASKTELGPEEMQRYAEVINLVVKASVTEPQVGDKATDKQIAVMEIEMLDRVALFNDSHIATRPLRRPSIATRVSDSPSGPRRCSWPWTRPKPAASARWWSPTDVTTGPRPTPRRWPWNGT